MTAVFCSDAITMQNYNVMMHCIHTCCNELFSGNNLNCHISISHKIFYFVAIHVFVQPKDSVAIKATI
jgi:hypothetical protein